MDFLLEGILAVTPQQIVMYIVGALLIWLAIEKEYEPALLLPMGFGAILVNLPLSGVINQTMQGIGETQGIIEWLFKTTIEASEALPVLLFIGIGAMIDFGPLLSQPVMFLFGAAAQFGIFFAICLATLLGFDLRDAASIGIIGAADGPTSILVSQILHSRYVGAIAVAAYSYMALVPIIQPFAIRLVPTKKERCIRMQYNSKAVTRKTRLLFPIITTIIVGLISPASVASGFSAAVPPPVQTRRALGYFSAQAFATVSLSISSSFMLPSGFSWKPRTMRHSSSVSGNPSGRIFSLISRSEPTSFQSRMMLCHFAPAAGSTADSSSSSSAVFPSASLP